MTTSWTIILILGGIKLRNTEITTLETASTAITENAITTEGSSLTVTASAEQIPRTCTVIGLLLFKGSLRSFRFWTKIMALYRSLLLLLIHDKCIVLR